MSTELNKKKKEIVSFFLKKNLLVTEDLLHALDSEENIDEIYALVSKADPSNLLIINNDIKDIIRK